MSGAGARIEEVLGRTAPLAVAREALGAEARAWVVGGAVRDALRGIAVGDLDLALDGDVAGAARAIAAAGEGHAFELSGEFSTWRVTARDRSWTLDVAGLRGGSIEDDLAARDFALNAIAVPLCGGDPIDPAHGIEDLGRGVLRAVSERSFADDPLRLLRAARLATGLGLEVDDGTAELARAEARRAAEPAGERQLAELSALVTGPDPVRGIELLRRIDVLEVVLPEVAALHGVGQSANHHLDAYDHTLEVMQRMREVEADLPRYAGEVADEVGAALAEPVGDGLTREGALRFASLLHDVGKPQTRVERDGWISFKGHDEVGAAMVRSLFGRLRSSRRLADSVATMTRDHLVLGFMVRERPLPPRRVWDYLSRTGELAIDTTLLTVADRLSAQGGGVPDAAIEGHLALAREMLAAAVELRRDGPPEQLLRGDELAAELGIEPGPRLGEAVRELAAAQYAGEVTSREEAVAHMLRWRGA
jgi:putative nucleotidyltransferase with HDIG domain